MTIKYSVLTTDEINLILDILDGLEGMPERCPHCTSPDLDSMEYNPSVCSEFTCLNCGLHVCVTCSQIY